MKPEIKQLWLDALRSRKYKQTQGCLRDNGRHCCLGVLCDLHAKATNGQWSEDDTYMDEMSTLPERVRRWAGLRSDDPRLLCDLSLTDLNDGVLDFEAGGTKCSTFSQIADIIEAEL